MFLISGAFQVELMPLVGRYGGKADQRLLVAVDIVGVAYSLWMNAHLTERSGFWDLVASSFVRSASLAFVFIPISVIALSDVAPDKCGNATGLFNLTRELGGSIGTAWMGLLIDRTNMFKLLLSATLSTVALAGCSSSVSPDVVRTKAASDLSCTSNQVKVEKVNDGNWKATGCNQVATYMCSGSSFMSSGMCMREGTMPTAATMPK